MPGTSNHGWALAVDLGGGINSFGTAQHVWMVANGPAYGWIHPTWARQGGGREEAWHFEYEGTTTTPPTSEEDDMTPAQAAKLDELHWMLSTVRSQDLPVIRSQTDRLPTIHAGVDLLQAAVTNITNGVKAILAKLGA